MSQQPIWELSEKPVLVDYWGNKFALYGIFAHAMTAQLSWHVQNSIVIFVTNYKLIFMIF